jgi:hypothetical protein
LSHPPLSNWHNLAATDAPVDLIMPTPLDRGSVRWLASFGLSGHRLEIAQEESGRMKGALGPSRDA